MARLGPTGLTQVFVEIKNWVLSKLSSKANDSDVVHKSGNETINGTKTFSNDVRISKTSPFVNAFTSGYIKGQAPVSNIYSGVRFFDDIDSGSANAITGGFEIEYNRDGYNKSYICSRNYAGETHNFFTIGLRVPNDDRDVDFLPSVNGIVNLGTSSNKWKDVYAITFNGNLTGNANTATKATQDSSGNVITTTYATKTENSLKANDADVVHLANTESITGNKYFTADVSRKITSLERAVTPETNTFGSFVFVDNNNLDLAYLRFASRTYGKRELNLFVKDSEGTVYGIDIATDKSVVPNENNTYSLGTTKDKWNNVYSTTFTGDLVGTADRATADASGNAITSTYATKTEVSTAVTTANAYADSAVASLVSSAPETLDTLSELATALGNDPNFATTVTTLIGTKANNSAVVHLTGNETINGTKTFSAVKFNISAADIAAIIV